MHFGATLRLLRLESGLSLRDLARRLSVSGAYLSRVENGLDSVPTPARLEAIARELDVPPPLLMGLAHRVSPLVVDYVQQEPEAGALFLEMAHRRLDGRQLAEVRAFLDERFPTASPGRPSPRGISDLLSAERIVLGLTCSSIDDALDVAASRVASLAGKSAPTISAPLKAREREVSSAIGDGILVPSAYLEGVALAAVLVTLADPLKYETPDGQPLRALVLLAGPRDSRDRRLRLAQLARLTARGLADRLADVRSPKEVLSRLVSMEAF
jgi:PTS system nitrogen regulatory IIA component